jgi:outer membrane protein assembly factor BamB
MGRFCFRRLVAKGQIMKRILLAIAVLLLPITWVNAQSALKVYTAPKLPGRESLERMNLSLAWNTRAAVDGNRDGIFSLQLIPGERNQLIAQTYKGGVFLYDAENGDLIWKTWVGEPYWVSQPVGFNSHSIFVTRRDVLHVLNRFTGAQRVYHFPPGSKLPTYGVDLLFTPSAAPVADEEFLYIAMGSRLNAFVVPDFEVLERIKRAREVAKKEDPTGEKKGPLKEEKLPYIDELPASDSKDTLQAFLYWGYTVPNQTIEFPPLFSGEQISVLTPDGVLTSVNRYEKGPRVENFDFKFAGRTLGSPGQHGRMAYVGSNDFNLYAVDMNGGKLVWRYPSGAPIQRKPAVNDREVFIAPYRVGLRSVDRRSGRENWTNHDTQTFLATNNQYVYALDKVGKFFVLDARRGATLAKYDLSEWTIAVANEWTDRVYLAANDGQIICLRHRDLVKPLSLKTTDALPKPKDDKKKEPKKEDEKKEDPEKAAARMGGVTKFASSVLSLTATFSAPLPEYRRRGEDYTQMDDRRAGARP